MSDFDKWFGSLGKVLQSYKETFEDNGYDDIDLLGDLEVTDMVSEMGIKRIHANAIYKKYKKEFGSSKAETLKPHLVKTIETSIVASSDQQKINIKKITSADEEKADLQKIALFEKDLAGVFQQHDIFIELIKFAKDDVTAAKALSLFHEHRGHISSVQRKPPSITYRGFLSHVQRNSGDLCGRFKDCLKLKGTSV